MLGRIGCRNLARILGDAASVPGHSYLLRFDGNFLGFVIMPSILLCGTAALCCGKVGDRSTQQGRLGVA